MKTAFTIAVTGAINSGKSTLARRLAQALGAELLSSDDIRATLSHRQRRRGERVFATMHERLESALSADRPVVLDSTGMSARFRAILRAHRGAVKHVHLRLESVDRFEERERGRTDRPGAPMPRAAFFTSCRVEFHDPPDLVVATDGLTSDEVYLMIATNVLY